MKTRRNVYLKMKTLEEACRIIHERFPRRNIGKTETVEVPQSVGRVLAAPVWARLSSPGFNAAAMDGVAVRADSTFGASETQPKELVVEKDVFFLNTGHVMPPDTDAVIMIEHLQERPDTGTIVIEAPVFPWQNVRKMGEDIVATELLFPRGHLVTPYCVGALLTAGVFEVAVIPRPRVKILPTGTELVDWRSTDVDSLKPGQVFDSNSFVLGGLVKSCGGTSSRHDILKDDAETISATVQAAVGDGYDMVFILGGSSAGSEDFARSVIASLGDLLIHGVTIMPGKPVVVGDIDGTPVFGIPGYQVSAIIAFEQFAQPLLLKFAGRPPVSRETLEVVPTRKIPSRLGVEEFVRAKLGRVGGHVMATPLSRGSGAITTLTEAHGIIRIPNNKEGLPEDKPVTVELLRPIEAIDKTIVCVGSHDNSLDLLTDQIRKKRNDITLSSSHVGSMGGIMAIKRGVCHLAGTHLLDTQDGTYNISYIRKYLGDRDVRLVNLVFRDQGLIVQPGNPKNIQGIEDLARADISFINRQRGSGTRILLDYRIDELDISPQDIRGYQHEEFTHMAVAAAVVSGMADAGMGIYAAAKALDLDFIPVVTEQYDLIVPSEFYESEQTKLLLGTINSSSFQKRVEALGGYSTRKTGELIWHQRP